METLQTTHLTLAQNEYKYSGLWDRNWVRPFESLWGIFNNYKAVNVISNHSSAMTSIGFNMKAAVTKEYFLSYGIFCNLSRGKNDVDNIIAQFVPDWYIKQIEEWTSKQGIAAFISSKIMYCPQCMKNGYHSILHQLKGIRKCPFHPNVSMISYLKQSYILGVQSNYEGEKNNIFRSSALYGRELSHNCIDFANVATLPLPSDWKSMPEINEYFRVYGVRTSYDYIQPIGADIYDKDVVPSIGEYLLKSKSSLLPDIVLYDIEKSDKIAIQKIVERAAKHGLVQKNMALYSYKQRFKYIFLQIVVAEMLDGFTSDEIEYKCYQIETGKFISCNDKLGKILLYLLFLIGDDSVEECLNNVLKTRDIASQYGLGYQYMPSDVCIHDLKISNLCISAQYYILDEFIRMNWKKFETYLHRIGGLTKPINHRDLILHPFHLIYEKTDNQVYIYRCF